MWTYYYHPSHSSSSSEPFRTEVALLAFGIGSSNSRKSIIQGLNYIQQIWVAEMEAAAIAAAGAMETHLDPAEGHRSLAQLDAPVDTEGSIRFRRRRRRTT